MRVGPDRIHIAVEKLYKFVDQNFWDGGLLFGPDPGARLNFRAWRFIKSYLSFLPWSDHYVFMQAQAYWILCNWQLSSLTKESRYSSVARNCTRGILSRQMDEGYWEYPIPEWSGRIGTIEGNWAAKGLQSTYENTGREEFLHGALRWYDFLVKQIGFQQLKHGLAVNYFANRATGAYPNASTLTLSFLGKLAHLTEKERYLEHCSGMIAFLSSVQRDSGEFPYVVESLSGKGRSHYQCFQYHAFQLLDLAKYHHDTGDTSVLPIITKLATFLVDGVGADGRTQYDCSNKPVQVVYHTAAVAGALQSARSLGVIENRLPEDRAYNYVLSKQHDNGGFAFSKGDYLALRDRRYYPRYLAMILHHLLLRLPIA